MGEILGVGVTHYPGLFVSDDHMADILRRTLRSVRVPASLKEIKNWPEAMQAEWGVDEGKTAAAEHRRRLLNAFRKVRTEIESFEPDFLLIWGDDQYENFQEDCVPPFCIFIIREVKCTPLKDLDALWFTRENIWGEPEDKEFVVKGHPSAAKYLIRRLMEEGFDISYSYTPRSEKGLSHAFMQTILLLDYDRAGFDFPVVPFHVNAYGSHVIRRRGAIAHLTEGGSGEPDPAAPTPKRCFELGQATARILRQSPWRVVLIGSSSWSHAFLTDKNFWLYPDIDSDRKRYEELKAVQHHLWRDLSLSQIEEAGQHEILNWVCLAGAMVELGRKAEIIDYVETYIFNSNKCFAIFR
jgi:hypothetical protein